MSLHVTWETWNWFYKKFFSQIKTQFVSTIHIFILDNGLELMNSIFHSFFWNIASLTSEFLCSYFPTKWHIAKQKQSICWMWLIPFCFRWMSQALFGWMLFQLLTILSIRFPHLLLVGLFLLLFYTQIWLYFLSRFMCLVAYALFISF